MCLSQLTATVMLKSHCIRSSVISDYRRGVVFGRIKSNMTVLYVEYDCALCSGLLRRGYKKEGNII